jgi:hypothetical protein
MKRYRVTATFPELSAAHAVQEARGEGSSLSVGIKRALDAILRERHVKGRRMSTVKFFVRVERPDKGLSARERRSATVSS